MRVYWPLLSYTGAAWAAAFEVSDSGAVCAGLMACPCRLGSGVRGGRPAAGVDVAGRTGS